MSMKKNIMLLMALAGLLNACKKSWLEIIPVGVQAINTTADYDKVMNDQGLYSYSIGGWSEAQLMGDDIAAQLPFFANKGSNDYREIYFRWTGDMPTSTANSAKLLGSHLTQIYQLNKIINEVMNSIGGTDAQKKSLRAEALATRAWSNFNMMNYYCKPYAAATAATDPGFPVITLADVTMKNFPRGTVQQSYDAIIKDLTDALTDIPVKPAYVTRWSKPAVEGFLGKVYLFMGRNNDALPYLKAALTDVAANGQTILYDYNKTLAPGGSFLPIDMNTGPVNSPGNIQVDVKEAVVSKVFTTGVWNGNYLGTDGLRLSAWAQALFAPSDLRLQFYTTRNEDNSVNAAGRLRKYGVRNIRFGLQLSELYLLNAECKARTNDLTGAVTDVETLRRNRMPVADAAVPSAIAANQTALIKFIVDERMREFAMEGYRWFDMRRLSVDPLYAGITFTHTIYNADGTTNVINMDQPNRLVLRIPPSIADKNPDMVNNP